MLDALAVSFITHMQGHFTIIFCPGLGFDSYVLSHAHCQIGAVAHAVWFLAVPWRREAIRDRIKILNPPPFGWFDTATNFCGSTATPFLVHVQIKQWLSDMFFPLRMDFVHSGNGPMCTSRSSAFWCTWESTRLWSTAAFRGGLRHLSSIECRRCHRDEQIAWNNVLQQTL